jgi:hypothetical protein
MSVTTKSGVRLQRTVVDLLVVPALIALAAASALISKVARENRGPEAYRSRARTLGSKLATAAAALGRQNGDDSQGRANG